KIEHLYDLRYIDYKGLKVKLENIQQSQYVEPESPTTYFSNVCESPTTYGHSESFQSFPFTSIKEESIKEEDENQTQLQNESIKRKPTHSDPVRPSLSPLKIKIDNFRRANSLLTKVPSRLRSKSIQRTPIISLDTIKNQLRPDEVEFFEALDIELKKINDFYEEKESDAREHFNRINQSYEELKALKAANQSNSPRSDWTSKLFKERDNNISSPSTNETLFAIDYKDARKRMKKAIFEFYRGIEMLKHYRNINHAGFKKILEKFDTVTKLNGSETYLKKVNQTSFVKSKRVDVLMKDTEYIFNKLFGGSSRSYAKKKLKTPNRRHKTYYLPTIRSGIYIGLAAPSLYNALKIAIAENGTHELQLYAGLILPMILLLLIGVIMYVWTKLRINYKFIFELNPRQNLDFRQYIEITSFMLLLVCLATYADVTNLFSIQHPYYPLILVIVILAVVLCPFRIFYYSARRWFVFGLGRMLISPFIGIEFREFIIADHCNSLSYTFGALQVLPCFA
ncbi:23256_t:CDS:10, partial [Dentiscutata erythropus]